VIIDLAFFSATLLKIADGGWFPLALGSAIFLVMTTWRRGRQILFERLRAESVPLAPFMKSLFAEPPLRVPGTAVYLTATPETTPHALLHTLKHFKALHQRVVFLSVEFLDVPHAAFEERVACERLGRDCWRVRVRYGFMNRPDVVRALEACSAVGLGMDFMDTSFFLSRQTIVPIPGRGGMAFWRERLFAAMARNASNVTDFFNIPANRAVELGTRVEI
jgi:KUP system potassium uptake protein